MAFTREEVAEIYVATFNRAADSAGLDYWVNDSGLTEIEEVASSLFDSAEAQVLYPDGTTSIDMVESAYQNLFGRSADVDGLEYWTNELDSGAISQSLMLQAMIDGAQDSADGMDATYMANKTTVGLEYADAGHDDIDTAKSVMSGVTDDMTSVESAQEMIIAMPNENLESEFNFTPEYLQSTTLYEVYDTDGDGVYEGLISMEFTDGVFTKTDADVVETLTYTVDEAGVIALSDGTYISAIKDMAEESKLATAWYDNDLDSATNATMSSSHQDDAFKFIFTSLDSVDEYISSAGMNADEDHGNSSVDTEFDFSSEFLNNTTLYNVYDKDGDGVYEGLVSMEFIDGSLTNTDGDISESLSYTIDENGIISLSDGTYISGLVNVVDENKIASAWDIDLVSVSESTAESAQEDGTFEYMFTSLDSATNFIA